jgi:hypothetical protein
MVSNAFSASGEGARVLGGGCEGVLWDPPGTPELKGSPGPRPATRCMREFTRTWRMPDVNGVHLAWPRSVPGLHRGRA